MASVSTAVKTLYFFDGTVWIPVGGGGAPTGASVIYSDSQPDVTNLEVGTIWVDSDATISGGGGGGGGTGGPSFQTIVTSPVSASIVAQTSGEILTLISGENISIVNASANNSVTINSTGNYSSVNSISTPDYIQFDTTANTNPVTGLMGWDSVEGTLNLGLSSGKHIHLGEESVFRVRNSTGSTIGKGTALYASGVEPSGRIQVTPYVANGSVREVRFMGLATESISSGVNGFVQHFGYVRDLDTRGTSSTSISVGDETWAAGDLLYVHPTVPGKLTNVKPQHEIVVAIIIIRHQSTGILFVRPTSGGHLEDIHNISLSSLSNEDILIYNSASSIWVNSPKQNIINTASAAAVSYLVDGAPEALNTLNELSEALNDNADILDTLLTTTAASSTYLPISASASFYRWTKTYSASASVISGVDDNSISLSYNEGYIQLFINGVMLDPSEYTATSGSAITVSTPVLSGEVVDIFAFLNSTSVNTYSQAQIDNKYNNLTRWKKAYSASATVISGVDDNSNTLSYLSGYEQFYLNGILLTPITDYARTDSSNITLSTPLISGDIVEIINTQPFNVADVYNTSQSDNRYLTQSSASTTYLTQSNGITAATASATYIPQSSPVTSFKNKIINSEFDIWQRGTTFSAGGYTADRWLLQVDGSSATRAVSQQALTPGSITGYESPFFLRYNQSVAGSSATFNILDQRIEDVRTLAGQVVTVSFWAKADSSRTITSSIQQVFGTGGSSEVAGLASGNINITTSWTRYSYTGTLASISGKTVGTNSYAAFRINFPINATFTVDIWGVQVERGSIATEFEQRFIGTELQMCQRYYETGTFGNNVLTGSYVANVYTGSTPGFATTHISFKVTKRITPHTIPTLTISGMWTSPGSFGVTASTNHTFLPVDASPDNFKFITNRVVGNSTPTVAGMYHWESSPWSWNVSAEL